MFRIYGVMEAAIGIEPMYGGFADLCLTAWLRRPEPDSPGTRNPLIIGESGAVAQELGGAEGGHRRPEGGAFGAGNGIRTRDFNLGKVALYH